MDHIGSYRLLSGLGRSGTVHRAAGPDGRDVAIRLLPPDAAPDIDRMRDVLSPYAVDVLDGDAAGSDRYVVSRFVPGRPLADTVAEHGPLPPAALRRLAFGLAKALAAIHEAGLVHGWLGPTTTLVVDDAPVVVDFGLAAGASAADDVRAWAQTVLFAATGKPAADPGAPPSEEPPLDELPADLRALVAAAADAAARPDAAELAAAASRLDLSPVPAASPAPEGPPAAAVPAETADTAAGTVSSPASQDAAHRAAGAGRAGSATRARGLTVARGWARLLAAMVVVIAVALVVVAPLVGLVVTLGVVTALRVAGAAELGGPRGWARAFGRTLLTVPYAAVCTVAVPLGLVAVSAVGGRIDSLSAAAFGAGAGAAVLWTAPGVSAPRRQLERMFLAAVRRPRRIAAAGAVLGGLALAAVVAALTVTPTFAPMYGLQGSVEATMDRLQTAVNRF